MTDSEATMSLKQHRLSSNSRHDPPQSHPPRTGAMRLHERHLSKVAGCYRFSLSYQVKQRAEGC